MNRSQTLALITLAAGMIIILFLVASKETEAEHPDYAPDVLGDVREIDGVLYYPDGMPVRNYEQLNVYLETANETGN